MLYGIPSIKPPENSRVVSSRQLRPCVFGAVYLDQWTSCQGGTYHRRTLHGAVEGSFSSAGSLVLGTSQGFHRSQSHFSDDVH